MNIGNSPEVDGDGGEGLGEHRLLGDQLAGEERRGRNL